MSAVFEKGRIGNLELANRFVRSATWMGMATEDGRVTPRLIKCLEDLAHGGLGLIISGHAYVTREGQAGPLQMGIWGDELLPGLEELVDAVHAAGGKVAAQLAHAGLRSPEDLTGTGPRVMSLVSPEEAANQRLFSLEDLAQLARDYASAAVRARQAGFDGVQLHCAHGYLFSQSISPLYNLREDEYGGEIVDKDKPGRAKLILESYRAVRAAVGPDYPVMIKINCQDFVPGALNEEDSRKVVRLLAAEGLDAVEISGGTAAAGKFQPARKGINKPEKEAYFREQAKAVKAEVDIPVILVGGNRSLEVAGQMLDGGVADFIALCRPLICEPGLVKRWQEGDTAPAKCVSDSLCFAPARSGQGAYCVTEEEKQSKSL